MFLKRKSRFKNGSSRIQRPTNQCGVHLPLATSRRDYCFTHQSPHPQPTPNTNNRFYGKYFPSIFPPNLTQSCACTRAFYSKVHLPTPEQCNECMTPASVYYTKPFDNDSVFTLLCSRLPARTRLEVEQLLAFSRTVTTCTMAMHLP